LISLLLAHGDLVPKSELGSAWETPPAVLAGAGLALLLFGQAWIRLRRRGRVDLAGVDRAFLFVAAVVLGTLALVSPLDAIGEEYLLSAHMLEHVLIGDAAVALALVALRGPLTFFFLPGRVLRPLARVGALRSFLRFLLRPKVSFAIWAAVLAGWHYPAAYDYVLDHQVVHDLQHVTFVLAGVLVWTQLVDPARRRELRYPGRIAQDERLLGLSPLGDQRLAGVVMMVEQAVTLGTCVAFLLVASHRQVVRREAAEAA
jgi:cytochrome c oxidase assembly factor CtaG